MQAVRLPKSSLSTPAWKRSACLPAVGLLLFSALAFAESATTTTFSITANGVPLSSIGEHNVVRLTATVMAGSTKITTGQVKFCNADLKSCENFREVGMAQLTKDGTAITRFIPGPGVHHYKAVFVGTTSAGASSSAVSTLTVNPANPEAPYPTRTTINAVGSKGSYTLTANVTGPTSTLPLVPGGLVFFQDKSNANAVLGQVVLPSGLPAINYTGISQPPAADLSPANEVTAGYRVGDFDSDGKPDMVLCRANACPAIALGNGDGTFREPPHQPALLSNMFDVQVADFNADGKLDLIAITHVNGTPNYTNYFYAGEGNGTFLAPVKLPLTTSTGDKGIVRGIGDFNRDGISDLVVVYNSAVEVALGNGDGSFRNGWMSNKWTQYFYTAVGDFDGDGFKDFAVSHSEDGESYIGFFFGSADGSFTEVNQRKSNISGLTGTDVNGDGITDLLVGTNEYDYDQQVVGFEILAGHRDRTFTSRLVFGVEPRFSDVGAPWIDDFNQDGIADVAINGYSVGAASEVPSQTVLLGNRDGSFTQVIRSQPATATSLQNANLFATADFNGDGLPDVAAVGAQASTGYGAYAALVTQVGQSAIANIRPPVGAGDHEVVARYAGDPNFVTSVSKRITLTAPPQGSPVVTLSSSFLEFGNVSIGSSSNAQTIVLTNTGSGALTINAVGLENADFFNPPFATSNNCPASLAAGASCQIRVRFVPGSAGNKSALLQLQDNAGSSPQVIALTGTGVRTP